MPISTGIDRFTSLPCRNVNENGVSPLLDLIIVRWAHRTCGSSSIQSLLFSSSLALNFYLLFQLDHLLAGVSRMRRLDGDECTFLHQSLKWIITELLPLSDFLPLVGKYLQTCYPIRTSFTCLPLMVARPLPNSI
ncbi:hypothetical protein Tco_0071645 [Tanacetum coccineum]